MIKKGIQEIMGGVLLDYPAKTILNKGLTQAAAQLGMSEDEFATKMS